MLEPVVLVVAGHGVLDPEEAVVEAHLRGEPVASGDPVERPLDLAPVGGDPPAGALIPGAAQLDDLAVLVLDDAGALEDARVAQADLLPWRQAEPLLGGHLGEVLALDVELTAEGDIAAGAVALLRVVGGVEDIDAVLGPVLDHHLERAEHRHHPGRGGVEVLA